MSAGLSKGPDGNGSPKIGGPSVSAGASALSGLRGVEVLQRSDGTYLALFVDRWRAQVTTRDNPEVMLDELPAGDN
jgi:peptide chain release factor 3